MKTITLSFFVLCGFLIKAQTPQENLDKYWKYRDKLRKEFMQIGNEAGNSIPMCARAIGFAYDGAPFDSPDEQPSRIWYQDATIYLGHYLAVLATEHKLLSNSLLTANDAENIQSQINSTNVELYYALQTLNRLDVKAESYLANLAQNPSESDKNGLLMRDDVKANFHTNFEEDYSVTFERYCNFIRTHSSNNPVKIWPPNAGNQVNYDGSNVMSLDQVTSVLMGLKCVWTLVPSESILPANETEEINIKEEARNIALRIIHYIVNDVDGCTNNCKSFNIRNFDGLFRPAGYDLTFAAPFLVKLALEFQDPEFLILQALDDLQNMRIAFQMHPQALLDAFLDANNPIFGEGDLSCQDNIEDMLQDLIASGQPVTIGSIKLSALFSLIDQIQSQNIDLSVGGNPCLSPNQTLTDALNTIELDIEGVFCDNLIEFIADLILSALHIPSIDNLVPRLINMIDSEICLSSLGFYNSNIADNISNVINDDNVHIFLELATISNKWNKTYISTVAHNSDMDWYGMLHDVLNNNQQASLGSNEEYISTRYLDSAPCIGPWDDPNWEIDNTSCDQYDPKPETTSGWRGASRLFHPGLAETGDCDRSFRGEFSGLDYMLYFNLHQLLWNPENSIYERNISCECVSEITLVSNLSVEIMVKPKFDDYKSKGIPIESYLAHDLTVTSNSGILNVKNDLIICRENSLLPPTTLTITNGAKLNLYGGNTITVREGNKIIVQNGSSIKGGITYTVDGHPEYGTYTHGTIHLEKDAELHILSGSLLEFTEGLTINMDEGAKLIIDDSDLLVLASSSGNQINIHGSGSSFSIQNGSHVNAASNTQGLTAEIFHNSTLNIRDSFVSAHNCFWNLHDHCELTLTNSQIHCASGGFMVDQSSNAWCINSTLNLNTGTFIANEGSSFHAEDSHIKISNGGYISISSSDGFNSPSHFYPDHCELEIIDSQSKLSFSGGKLHVADNQTFTFSHEDAESGYIEILPGTENMLVNGINSVFLLQGDNQEDEILRIQSGAHLQNPNFGQGDIVLRDGLVNMDYSGAIYTDMNFRADNVHFTSLGDGKIYLWYTHGEIKNSKLTECFLQGYWSTLNASDNVFEENEAHWYGGGYHFSDCIFNSNRFESSTLQLVSTMYRCSFLGTNGPELFYDESIVEVQLSDCQFNGLDNNVGIYKWNGKLSLKCCYFHNCDHAIIIDKGVVLNMSTSDFAGYNIFVDNEYAIGSYGAIDIALNQGYNNFQSNGGTIIDGGLQGYSCVETPEGCFFPQLLANNNVWPNGSVPGPPLITLTANAEPNCGSSFYPCVLLVLDNQPSQPVLCNSTKPEVDFHRNLVTSYQNDQPVLLLRAKQHADTPAGQIAHEKDLSVGNPVITTSYFNQVELEDALVIAAGHSELVDTLGNDSLCVELFYQILSSGLDRTNEEIRWKMQWGLRNMKSAMEDMFTKNKLTQANNAITFEPVVQQYVDILNLMTDENVTDTTYKEQFYFELNKGQLFRTIGKPVMAYEIFHHIDDCQLDSLEQLVLNQCITETSTEIAADNQYWAGVALDSIIFSADTSGLNLPQSYSASQYFFGAYIDSPSEVYFIPCVNNYRNKISDISSQELSIFPNPSHGLINITYDGSNKPVQINLWNIQGARVYTSTALWTKGETKSIQLSEHLNSGTYFLELIDQEKIYRRKIVLTN